MAPASKTTRQDMLVHILTTLEAVQPRSVRVQEIYAQSAALKYTLSKDEIRKNLQKYCADSAEYGKKTNKDPAFIVQVLKGRYTLAVDYKSLISGHKANRGGSKLLKYDTPPAKRAAELYLDNGGLSHKEAAVAAGSTEQIARFAVAHEKGYRAGQEEGYAAGLKACNVTQDMLPLSMQKKNAVYLEQELKKLNAAFAQRIEQRVMEEVAARLEDTILPTFRKLEQEAKAVILARKGVMTARTFRIIQGYLHPDRTPNDSEAFNLFTEMKSRLLNEKEHPTKFGAMPATLAELEEARRKTQAERRSKRQSSHTRIAPE